MEEGKVDLTFIPIDELIKEVENRCSCFIASYEIYQDKRKFQQSQYGKGNWFDAVRLSAVLNNDILNNWNGELKTLQRLNEDKEDA